MARSGKSSPTMLAASSLAPLANSSDASSSENLNSTKDFKVENKFTPAFTGCAAPLARIVSIRQLNRKGFRIRTLADRPEYVRSSLRGDRASSGIGLRKDS